MSSLAIRLPVVGIGLLLAVVYSFYTKYYDSTPCQSDPPLFVSTAAQLLDTCQLFSTDYEEARTKFRAARKLLQQKSSSVQELSLPVASLTIDVAILPGNTEKYGTVVHSSGLHGVEGYAGSAIQLAILMFENDESLLPHPHERPTLVFLHGLNPVGMKEYRRCNENNVDLNRNAIPNFTQFLSQRDPNIANYDTFRSFLSPTDENANTVLPTPWYTTIGIWLTLLPQLFRHGFVALKRAMVSGQYHHAQGIFYGGQEWQPSLQRLVEFWESRPDLFRDAPSLIWIDVHTGLGPCGKDSLHLQVSRPVATNDENQESSATASARFDLETANEWHQRFFSTAHSITQSVTTTATEETSSAFVGYDLTMGMLTTFFADLYKGAGVFMVQEFGTLPAVLVGRSLILDNMVYQQSQRQRKQPPTNRETKSLPTDGSSLHELSTNNVEFSYRSPWLRNAFYPQSTTWRASVVQRGVALLLQAIDLSTSKAHDQQTPETETS
jgi:hypothetical protein